MNTLMNVLTVLWYLGLVLEAILVLGVIGLIVGYVLDIRQEKIEIENENSVGKHRAPQETALEATKRELREAKERGAWQDRFFDEYYTQGFYNTGEQVRRDDLVMTVYTEEL